MSKTPEFQNLFGRKPFNRGTQQADIKQFRAVFLRGWSRFLSPGGFFLDGADSEIRTNGFICYERLGSDQQSHNFLLESLEDYEILFSCGAPDPYRFCRHFV